MKENILILLAMGNETPEAISRICGVTPAYISQLKSDPNFLIQLEEEKQKYAVGTTSTTKAKLNTSHDEMLDLLETRTMTKLGQLIPMIQKPMEAAKVLQVLNTARRKDDLSSGMGNINISNTQNTVILQLPQVIKTKLMVNSNNEVVQVGERPLVTMDSQHVLKVNKERNDSKAIEMEKTHRTNPTVEEMLKEIM